MDLEKSPLWILEKRLGADWGHLKNAAILAESKRKELSNAIRGIDSTDTSVVAFGSLGRNEFTEASDIDWTLLIDGPVDPRHIEIRRNVAQIIDKISRKGVGQEGLFGNLTFSHDLVHQIGGEEDTNRNATRRILLLLESRVIGHPEAHARVIRQVLNRYVFEDDGFVRKTGRYHIPRFLLNDFARNWWTMAVDFAYKKKSRFGKGAAIRNIKLRFSRKLLYVSGLLTCFGCHIALDDFRPAGGCASVDPTSGCIDCLIRRLERTPIEILADAFLHLQYLKASAKKTLDAYEGFLGILTDESSRTCLENLDSDRYDNGTYDKARILSHEFRDGLMELFFDQDSGMYELTRNYGVF